MVVYFDVFFWELLSILSLTLFGLFWLIEKISHERYPETILIGLLIITAAASVLWVKFELAVPAYWVAAVVNLILAATMACIGIHFLVLIVRACRIRVPRLVEQIFVLIAFLAVVVYGGYLFMYATPEQFALFDTRVDSLIRPFWIIVILTLLARWRVGKR